MKTNKYILEKSKDLPGWWVFTDTENLVVIRFQDRAFNETQRVTVLEDSPLRGAALAKEMAKVMREMGEWLSIYHGSKCFSCPYGYERSEDDMHLFLYRNKPPRWRLEIPFDFDEMKLANSLTKAGAWLKNAKYRREANGGREE